LIERNGVELLFHHMGIPTTQPQPGERYSSAFGLYTSDARCGTLRVQWHRFTEDSPLHPLMQTLPHAAFKVADLERAVGDSPVILGPYEPIPGYRVAMIDDGGIPVEFIQTDLTDAEIWARADGDDRLDATGAF